MRFLYPKILLLLIPLLLIGGYIFFHISRQRKVLKLFGDTELVKELMPDLSLRRKLGRHLILLIAMGFMIAALARPQVRAGKANVKREGIEMIVCLDISNSMYSDDVKPSRLARAKALVSRMMETMSQNKVGLIYFAGEAYVQLPITADLVSAKMFLDVASPNMIERQGTALDHAIRLAIRSFSGDEKVQKAIILVTDVEDHEGDVMKAVAEAKGKGISIHVVGVGSPNGGPIRLPDAGYLTDEQGDMVVTKLNEQMGQEIVAASGGVYVRATDVSATTKVLKDNLDKLEKSDLETTMYSTYEELYHYFLIPALILLAFSFIYLDRKNRHIREMGLFEPKKHHS
ncbi:MAG: VWA domain-containing protein [Porphyromonas sp.]|nr:VWA domain-containing protein [Porphyromonas sp.]